MIRVQNLTKKYKNQAGGRSSCVKYALDNVSLDIKEGTITAILGINGSGKTSLLKSIMGFIKPTRGHITIDDQRPSYNLYKKMIYVPDCPTHFP